MEKIKRLLALILVVTFIVTSLPLAALASGIAATTDDTYGVSSSGSGLQYALSLEIELNEVEHSLGVEVDAYSLNTEALGGILVVTLYENKNGIPQLIDLFTEEIPGGALEETPDSSEATGKLSFTDAASEDLMVSAVICSSLDELIPLSASVSYDANGFDLAPVSIETLSATEVTKTSAVLHGQVMVEEKVDLNAADFGFLVFNSLGSEVEEEMDEDGNPVGVILPDALPAASISSDGHFSLPLPDLESGQEYQYMAVSMGKVTAYGEPEGFTTQSDLPAVETNASVVIDSEKSLATIKGTITDTKGFVITESGMMFGTDPNSDPTQDSSNQSELEGDITSYLPSLEPGKTYYYRAYAKNSEGIGYGKTCSFTMPAVLPEIKSASASFDPVTWKATFSAEIESDGGSEILERGFRYQYKTETEWKYVPSETVPDSNTFTLELTEQRQFPIGYYKVQAYLTNSEGMATQNAATAAGAGTISTPYLSEVAATFDNASVTVSSATLNGNITAIDYQNCQERGFEYKAAFDNLWLEVGLETGTFGTSEYTVDLEGLQPYTEYVFRAKAFTYAGWSYSPEISFTTLFSDSTRETAYQMKMDGKTGPEISEILKNNFSLTISDACASLKFAGFSALDIAAALKAAPYNAPYAELTAGLKAAGFDASAVADALQIQYADIFAYEGGNLVSNITDVLVEQGYSVDETVKVLRDYFGVNIVNIAAIFPAAAGVTTDTVYASLIRIYGPYAFARDYWSEYQGTSNPGWYIEKLAGILKDNTAFSAGDIAAVLKEVYPGITAYQFITNCRGLYPAVSDMGDAVIQAFGADPLTAVNEMSKYSSEYPINEIKTWLIRKHGLDAPRMVEVMMGLPKGVGLDPINTVPELLKDDFGITSATDAAKVMYEAGWKEDEITSYSYWRVLKLLIDHFSCTPSDLIDIMKELELPPLTVARQMDALKTHSYISSWMPEYKARGYTASDLAAWCRTIDYYENVDQAVIVLGNAGYNLDEITAALKQVYELDANGALTILKFDTFINTYKWWTAEQATAAVNLAYNVNTLEMVIEEMKTNDATATQIANTLKETFAVSEPGNVAEYLIQLGYGKSDVLTALAESFRTLKNAELIQMLSQVLRDKFSEEPMDNMELILSLYENVKGSLNHAMNGVILMHESGFELSDITLMLQNDFDALKNVAKPFTAFEAGRLLLGLKAYGLTYDKLDVFAAVEEVYGVNFMLETVIDFKNNEKYTAETAITKLIDDFDVDTPSAAALCLKDAGYTMPEVLEGLADRNRLEKKLVIIELLRQVIKDVYPEEQAPMKVIMEAMGVENSGLASETLYRAGYSMEEIIIVLQSDYSLSSGETTELLFDRNFDDIVVNVGEVYGGNGYLDFVLYRQKQGDELWRIFDWLYVKLGVKDVGQIVNTLKLAGYESEDVITLLYTKRKEVVEDAILTVQQVFGDGSIQDYIDHRKSQDDDISQVFKWLQTLGVNDINDVTNYLYAAGYTSNELIEFLLSPAVQHENNYTFNVEEEYGDETVVNFLKEKKEGGDDIGAIYTLLTDQFAVSDLTQIVHYLKETGFSSNEIIAFVYMGSVNFNEQLISSSENDYGDNSIKELLAYRKSQGDGLAQLYTLLTQLDITETRQVTAYFQSAGFSGAEISQFFNEREISQGRQLIDLIQSVYEGDVISDYILGIQSDGTSALNCSWTLTDRFGIKDINQVIQYLNNGGYEDVEIVEAIDYQLHARRGIATLKTIYSTETPAQLINRLLATSLKSYYSVHDIVCSAKEAFPDTKHSEIILAIKNVGGKMNQIVNWLIYVNNNVSYKSFYLGLSREELDDLASILGSRNEYDLNLDTNDASYILFEFGYNLQEAIVRAKNANFSNYDVFMIAYQIIGDQGGGPRGLENHKALSAMEKEGYSINELAAVIVKYHRRHVDPNAGWDSNARENPYQTAYLGMMDLAGFGKPLPEVVAGVANHRLGRKK